MTPSPVIRPGRERLAGYQAALAEAGIALDPTIVRMLAASGTELALNEAKAMLGADDRPTAIMCVGTQMLAGVIGAINVLGLRVPENLSLIGIGDTELVRLSKPPITALRWDIAQCGRWAAQMMLDRLREGDTHAPFRTLEVPMEIVLRHSCSPPSPISGL